jgi:hypothetical protein
VFQVGSNAHDCFLRPISTTTSIYAKRTNGIFDVKMTCTLSLARVVYAKIMQRYQPQYLLRFLRLPRTFAGPLWRAPKVACIQQTRLSVSPFLLESRLLPLKVSMMSIRHPKPRSPRRFHDVGMLFQDRHSHHATHNFICTIPRYVRQKSCRAPQKLMIPGSEVIHRFP